MLNIKKRLMSLGIFIFNIIFFTIFVSTVLFMFGGSISKINICLAVVLSVVFCYFTNEKSIKDTIIISVISLLIFVLLAAICSGIYEWSYDGNTYRKSMIGMLKLGWNPLYETFYSAAEPYSFLENCTKTWYDAYPKATEIFAAGVYSFTENIESGKCFNLMAMVGAFAICMSYLIGTGKLKIWQSGLCALVCIWNPVNLSQCFTLYNDAFLGILLLLCTAAMMNLTFYEHKKQCLVDYYIIFLTINLGFNSKFSALIFFALLCLAFFFYWIYEKCKKEGWKQSKRGIFERFSVFAVSVLSGLLLIGSTSYVTNTIRYHNPLYTMIGEGSTDVISIHLPKDIKDMSHIQRFFASFFAPTQSRYPSIEYKEPLTSKFPFDFTKDNFYHAGSFDVRLGGWGVLFSGIFILSLIVLCKILYTRRKRNPVILKITAILAIVFVVLVLFVPGLFWARYFTLLFWIPVAALVFAFMEVNEGRSSGFMCGALVALTLLNSVPNMVFNSDQCDQFEQIEADFELLEIYSQKQSVIVDFKVGVDAFPGQFFNIMDRGIEFKYGKIEDNVKARSIYGLRYSVIENESEPQKISEYFSSANDNLIIFIAAKDEASNALNDEMISGMRDLGLKFEFKNCYRQSYLAVIDGGEIIYEGISEEAQTFTYDFENKEADIISAGFSSGNVASIKIGDVNYSCNKRGLNFVIYDKESKSVIDSFYVDTYINSSIER